MADPVEPRCPVIALAGVGKRFGGDPPVDALSDVDLSVSEGEWVAIVGASGSGKSTLLNIVGCLDHHSSGSFRFDGIEVSELSDRQRAGLRCRRIGFIFQSFHLLGHRSVTENVMLADVYRRAPVRDRQGAGADRPRASRTGPSRRVPPDPVVGWRTSARGDRSRPHGFAATVAVRRTDGQSRFGLDGQCVDVVRATQRRRHDDLDDHP